MHEKMKASAEELSAGHTPEVIAALRSAPIERTFVLKRFIPAPRELVWRVMTDPAQIQHWWGPRSTTYQAVHYDFKPGGTWKTIQAEPANPDHTFYGRFVEVEPPHRLLQTFEYLGAAGAVMLEELALTEVEGGTMITDTMWFTTEESYAAMVAPGADQGAQESFDRLEERVAASTVSADEARREIVLTRTLPYPPEVVWSAWSDPAHTDVWWGPTGFRNATHSADFRTGGHWRYTMHGPDGIDYPNLIQFEEMSPYSRIAYRHGSGEVDLAADPDAFRTTVTFEPSPEGTQLTMRMLLPTVEARRQAVEEIGAIAGGNQTLDRMTEYVSQLQQA